jgi:ubiquinone/menaquinone biosynthesis C-methylase UbiE/pimeloyl-ACP methyl ester carboxylesterase
MLNRSTPIVATSLRGLHPRSIDDATQICALLDRARSAGCVFHRGLNAVIDLETAEIERIDSGDLILRAPNFERISNPQIFLNFTYAGRPYFFATTRTAPTRGELLTVRIPETIFYSERRDRLRRKPNLSEGDPQRVEVSAGSDDPIEGLVTDLSPDGLGVLLRGEPAADVAIPLKLKFLDGREAGTETRVQLRSRRADVERKGWTRIGIVRTKATSISPIEIEYRETILDLPDGADAMRDREIDSEVVEPRVLRFENSRGEEIVALLDSWGDLRGATAVVMPSGWGRTKEALLPLARTIVATFRAAREPVCVVRFDGVRKRGESYNDPECRVPGREYHHFVFSQGVDDIETITRSLRELPSFQASSVILVSFSAAAIEARKALARDRTGVIDGWVSVVGSPDIQSMARSISGGVDLMGGYERGVRFGIQELLGVVVDVDRIVSDGNANNLIYIEDSRCDFAEIEVPITWYHGEYDAWVDLDRVRDVLSHGNKSDRRLVVIPTGHQLKNSREAEEAFQCIAAEVGRIALGREISPLSAVAREVRALRVAERHRLPAVEPDLRSFWRDYLVGRDCSFGIELLTSGSAYRQMMELQIDSLQLSSSERVIDLGAGTGSFELQLARGRKYAPPLFITAIDYVGEALKRARDRLSAVAAPEGLIVSYLEADLNLLHSQHRIPVESGSFEAAIASLLLSYLEGPELVLREICRILRPGGRMVISSLRRDADISGLYMEASAELHLGIARHELPGLEEEILGTSLRNFLNDASKVLELEEAGSFRFWEANELTGMVAEAGFTEVKSTPSLGDPPQAVVVSAIRR